MYGGECTVDLLWWSFAMYTESCSHETNRILYVKYISVENATSDSPHF